MYSEWLAQEHYRMHLMEEWPDGARKDAGLAAARSALESLERIAPLQASDFRCQICAAKEKATVGEYFQHIASSRLSLAA